MRINDIKASNNVLGLIKINIQYSWLDVNVLTILEGENYSGNNYLYYAAC